MKFAWWRLSMCLSLYACAPLILSSLYSACQLIVNDHNALNSVAARKQCLPYILSVVVKLRVGGGGHHLQPQPVTHSCTGCKTSEITFREHSINKAQLRGLTFIYEATRPGYRALALNTAVTFLRVSTSPIFVGWCDDEN